MRYLAKLNRYNTHIILAVLLALGFSTTVFAKDGIFGFVLDASTQKPVVNAQVTVVGTEVRTSTGADGQFVIPELPAGEYTLEASARGYNTQWRENISVDAKTSARVNFQLPNAVLLLKEIIVTPGRFALMQKVDVEFFPEIEGDRIRLEPESGEAKGVEIFLKRDIGDRLSWWASYAYAIAEDKVDSWQIPRSFNQLHTVHLDLNYRPNPKWRFNVAWQYHNGWPYTALNFERVEQPKSIQSKERSTVRISPR